MSPPSRLKGEYRRAEHEGEPGTSPPSRLKGEYRRAEHEGAASGAPTMRTAAVTISGVSKAYVMGGNPVPALRDVNLVIDAGDFVALTGPSGSGKSTLLNLCGLLDRADSGKITLDSVDVSGLDSEQLTVLRRERLGFVFQNFNLVPVMSVFENVEFPLFLQGMPEAERKDRVNRTLARVGLDAFAKRRPDELSGGQRQRVAIARALVKSARVVIADEPTANLDSVNAAQVVDLMRALARDEGTTCIIATHDPRVSDHCDRVVRLVDGVLQ